jgi:hypothetical protein
MNIFKKAEKIIVFVENPHIPFLNYFLLFLSSVTLRTFLEIFSDRAVVYFRFFPSDRLIYLSVWQSLAISFMHYYVFWVTLILTLGIIFYFITREDVGKILRTLLAFSFVLNITPLFDLIITAGRGGLDIAYVYPKNILNLLPIPKSLTPGMALTSITGFILSFIYCRVKTNSLKKGLLGALGIYILLVVTSLIPFLLKVRHPVPIIRAQLIIVFIELVLIFFWLKKQYFLALIKDVRYYRMLHFVSMFILGVILSGEPVTKVLLLNLDVFLLTFIAVSLSWIASVIFNNIEDLEIDKISNMNRPLVTHKIPQNDYRRIGIGAACLSGIFALGVNFQTLFFAYLLMGNALLVSLPPLRFKRIPIFSKLFISLSSRLYLRG